MKRISSYRKSLAFKKLSGLNIIILTMVNLVLPILIAIGGQWIIELQVRRGDILETSITYYNRIMILCLLLSMVILGILDIIFIVNPILSVENIVDEYGGLVEIQDMDTYDKYFTSSSLENMFLDMVHKQKQNIERQYKSEILRQETELIALQSQINPHFLYNTLDSIRGLALIHEMTEIADMTEALSNLFRNMIAKAGQMITLGEEFENINNYMLIQQFRFHNKFSFRREVSEELLDRYLVPNLTLQPIVENAIMHGLERCRKGGEVLVKAYSTSKRLILTVRDNGVGMSQEQLKYLNHKINTSEVSREESESKHHTGIALININQRIKLQFGADYGLSVMSTPNVSTSVEVVLPLVKEDIKEVRHEKRNS